MHFGGPLRDPNRGAAPLSKSAFAVPARRRPKGLAGLELGDGIRERDQSSKEWDRRRDTSPATFRGSPAVRSVTLLFNHSVFIYK
jgi:hypothetical protein